MTQSNHGISGGVVFWTLGGGTDFDKLLNSWSVLGHEKHAPDRVSTADAVKAALVDLYGGRENLVRPAKRKGGYCVVRETAGMMAENDYDERVVVQVMSGAQKEAYHLHIRGPDAEPERIRRAVNDQLDILPSSKVTQGLVAVVRSLGGVPMRETGGIYWIPEYNLAEWEGVARATEQSGPGNQVYVARTVLDEEGKRAVLAAIRSDIVTQVEKIKEEIETGGMTSERALKHRRSVVESLEARVSEYESALDVALTDIRTALATCAQAVVHLGAQEMGAAMGDASLGGEFAGMGGGMFGMDLGTGKEE